MIPGGQFRTSMPPLGFLVNRVVGKRPQRSNRTAVNANGIRGYFSARRFIHERHEFVGETGHGAADANATHVGAATDSRHPPTLWYVAVDHRPPAPESNDAFRRAVFRGEIALLVVAGAIAAFMNRSPE